jgi:hypothetical protein
MNRIHFQIVEKLSAGQWTIVRDPDVVGPVMISGREWIGYDDEESIAARVSLIQLRKERNIIQHT